MFNIMVDIVVFYVTFFRCKNGKLAFWKNTKTSETQNGNAFYTTTVKKLSKIDQCTIKSVNFVLGYSKIKMFQNFLRNLCARFLVPINESVSRKVDIFNWTPSFYVMIFSHYCTSRSWFFRHT